MKTWKASLVFVVIGLSITLTAFAEPRTLQRVDSNGNPIGSPTNIDIPDTPNSSATGQMTDNYGRPSGGNFAIPDAIQPPDNTTTGPSDGPSEPAAPLNN